MQRKPIAVVISDIHYKLDTLELADKALRMAIDLASELQVPVTDCGDLTNDKAILRAEVVNKLLETKQYAKGRNVRIISIVGNHSLLNEKSTEANALNFIDSDYWYVLNTPRMINSCGFIPYQPNPEDFYKAIEKFPKGFIVFGHQGTIGGQLGDYIQDHSKIDPVKIKDWRVFLGHYHAHYELENTVSIGNPYTLTYGEANDPEKGFLVVYSDGSYRRQLTGLRRHAVWEGSPDDLPPPIPNPNDLLWIKVKGTPTELSVISKETICKLTGTVNIKLDKIPLDDSDDIHPRDEKVNACELLDKLVDDLNDTLEQKIYLKQLWREVLKGCA